MTKKEVKITAKKDADGSQSLTVGITDHLPNPFVVEKWNELIPGAAREILDMAKAEQRSRLNGQDALSSKTRGDSFRATLGQITGFVIIMTTLIGSMYLIHEGKSLEGFGLILVPLAGLAGVMFYYREDLRDTIKGKQKK